ncbi:ribosome biogenesis GTP-binding protein YihA/YsxC [Parvularcula oceani]|uniref:ribosome biogenesis GTP-binding protein YihA/YsxC n=1 Tax=Parvularcula oceani TaxID=1247963 RepID=UPI0004E1881A|nr:ribosome biogenesis GTP-binding protein YihA/YsxC [Parvularcula oceani]
MTPEDARKLFAGPCDFSLGVVRMEDLPEADLPEVAFAGRSNVGKSSLLNALTGRKALARTSNTPGRTRELNFFDLGGQLRLVDLPGYGYARASRSDVESWTGLTLDYLSGRPNLRRVCVLIDSRHGLKPVDATTMDTLDVAAVPYQIVLTKSDKIKPPAAKAVTAAVAEAIAKRPAAHPDVLLTSSEKNLGLAELRTELGSLTDS